MSDELQPGDSQPETPAASAVRVDAAHDVTIGGDVVGRDKIVTTTIVGYTPDQVSTLIAQLSRTFQPKPFDGRCPYMGLNAFGEEDAEYFFGRERLVEELMARVTRSRAVVIAGPSGSGKSSLVRAGLIPALKRGALPGSDHWLYATFTPGRDPLEQLALAVARLAKSPAAGDYVRTHAAKDSSTLHKAIESGLSDQVDQRAVIFVDQFEETFTQVVREADRVTFLDLLTYAARVEGGRAVVLFAMRSDFVASFATYPELNDILNQQFFQVSAMQPEDLVRAIALPALHVGLRIDADLIAHIVNDMGDEPGALPLMQFALKDLFESKQAAGGVIALTRADYLERGGIHKALERHADAAFSQLSESERELARTVFSGLVQVGRGTQDTRRTAMLSELVPADSDPAGVEAVVRKLADARLITTAEGEEAGILEPGTPAVTLAHEKLLDAWPWLKRLVNENREAIELQNRIAEDAQEWSGHRGDPSYLYTGARLEKAREELAAQRLKLPELAQAFIEAALELRDAQAREAQARQARQLEDALRLAESEQRRAIEQKEANLRLRRQAWILRIAGAAALVAAIVAGIFGYLSDRNAREARSFAATVQFNANQALSRQLVAQASSLPTNQFALAALLSIEALKVADTDEAFTAVLTRLRTEEGQSGLSESFNTEPRGNVFSIAFSADGHEMATGNCNALVGGTCTQGEITLWDLRTRQPAGEPLVGHTDWVNGLAFSPDGQRLVSSSQDTSVILWNLVTRQPAGQPMQDKIGSADRVVFSPEGKTLISGSGKTWDAVGQQTESQPLANPPTGAVERYAFSRDGKYLAAAICKLGGFTACSGGEVGLWDLKTRESISLASADQLAGAYAVAFSPDGRLLASGHANGLIYMWDLVTRQPMGPPLRSGEVVNGLAFSPDGKLLAAGARGEIVLWDVTSLQRLGDPLSDQPGSINSLAFSPDGAWLISGGGQGTVFAWIMGKEAWQTKLCEVIGRNMTRQEWGRYFPTTPYRTTCPQWLEPSPTPEPSTTPPPPPTLTPVPTVALPTALPVALSAEVEAGIEALNRGDLQAAVDHCSLAIQQDGQNALAYYCRGTAYDRLGQRADAIADFSSAIAADPGFDYAYLARGLLYAAGGNCALALPDLQLALGGPTYTYSPREDVRRALEKCGAATPGP